MGRPAKGSITYIGAKPGEQWGHYQVRISLPGGKRRRIHLEPGPKSPKAERRARERAAAASEQLRAPDRLAGPLATMLRQESLEAAKREEQAQDRAWWERFFAHRDQLGMTHSRGRFRKYIAPKLEEIGKTILTLERTDCEAIRDHLDDVADSGRSSGNTVVHAWHVFTAACKAACGTWTSDKKRRLKVRESDPSAGILSPENAPEKELQWLYPNEVMALLSCEQVPIHARRRYAMAVYMFGRVSELIPLDWSKGDIDLSHGTISIRRAWSLELRKLKGTKSRCGVRRFNLEPTLLPLLSAMHKESGGVGPVLKERFRHDWAPRLREHLRLAGITRPELFTTDATRRKLRFHDLRATGLTWLALRKESSLSIQVRAGHSSFAMTQRYIRVAETVGIEVGELFPALPQCLFGSLKGSKARKVESPECVPWSEGAPTTPSDSGGFCPELWNLLKSLSTDGMAQPLSSKASLWSLLSHHRAA